MNIRGFSALAKMHRFRMDEHRRKAAEVDAVRAQLMQQDAALERELELEKSTLTPDNMTMTDFATYLKGIETRREELAKSIVDATRTRAQIADRMAFEYREAKKFELAMEREIQRRRKQADMLEQAELDEIGLNYRDREII